MGGFVHHQDIGFAGLPLADGQALPGFEVSYLPYFQFQQVSASESVVDAHYK